MAKKIQGLHSSKAATGRPGSPRQGQAAHKAHGVGTGWNVKSGVARTSPSRSMIPRPPVLANQAETSRTAQRMIPRPSQPFENPGGSLNVPAPTHHYVNTRSGKDNVYYDRGAPVNPNQKAGGYAVKEHSVHSGTSLSADEMAAVGYSPNATQARNPIHSGFPLGAKKQSGRPGTSSKRVSGRLVRQEV